MEIQNFQIKLIHLDAKQINHVTMKKSIKKLSKESLKQIAGSGATICCQTVCATGECTYYTTLPAKCPIMEPCI